MPRQNRVTPSGHFEQALPRGTLLGNRGILHDDAGEIGKSRWVHKNWVCCALEFGGRRQTINAPGGYTQLFFLDEAVSLAAGHRPCAECRRLRFNEFKAAWAEAHPASSPGEKLRASDLDAALHGSRIGRDRQQRTFRSNLESLPDGTFVKFNDDPCSSHLVWAGRLLRWQHAGYELAAAVQGADVEVTVLTPAAIVEVLRHGYTPEVHASARDL